MGAAAWDEVLAEAGVGLCLVGPDDRVRQASTAWLRATGCTAPTALGRPLAELFPGAGGEWAALLAQARATGRVEVPEGLTPQGARGWAGDVAPVPVDGGVGLLITARPVGRVAAPAPRPEDDDFAELRAAVEALPIGVALAETGPDGLPTRVVFNPAYTRLTGAIGVATAIGKVFRPDRVTPFPAAEMPGPRAARSGRPVRGVEIHIQRPDGTWRVTSVSAAPFDAPAGRRVLVIVLDVTDELQTQQALFETSTALSQREAYFRALIEHSTDMMILIDGRAQISFASPSATQTLGWSKAEMVGHPALDFVHPDDRERVGAQLASLLQRPETTAHALARILKKGGGWRDVDYVIRNQLDDPAVRGLIANGRDVTEQRTLEEQLRQSQKLDTIGRLAGGVAHDFNNLLVAILGYAELLEEAIPRGEADVADVAEIRRAGERARDLTSQLLAVARRQVSQPRLVDLNVVLRDAERFLRRILGEDIDIALVLDPEAALVLADPAQIHQVVMNLAVNARDAMPQGGKLTVETALRELGPGYAEAHHEVTPGPYVMLAVSDSGEGLSPSAREHLFEPFFTTKREGRGTGLGLAIVHGIIKQAGGFIWVYSEPNQGTTFKIYLPWRPDAPRSPSSPAPPNPPLAHGEHILLVEDDAAVRALATRALRDHGFLVTAANHGEEALGLVSPASPPALLVTDVVMPGMNGKHLAERLSLLFPSMRVLYVSGYTENTIVHQGILEPGILFLPKPFTPSTLVARVREVLG